MKNVPTATEFNALIRDQLDVECLLRTTLEFILARTGPTNGAVFLPTTGGDYSLGAYVNYNCPKDTVDVLFDHLASFVAPRLEEVDGIVRLRNDDELNLYLHDDADWMLGSEAVVFACRHDGEILALFLLFRDVHQPFSDLVGDQMRAVSTLFAEQLARVVRIHHRHLPKEKWGALGDPEEEPGDSGDLWGRAA